jgi:hypothetical protein
MERDLQLAQRLYRQALPNAWQKAEGDSDEAKRLARLATADAVRALENAPDLVHRLGSVERLLADGVARYAAEQNAVNWAV